MSDIHTITLGNMQCVTPVLSAVPFLRTTLVLPQFWSLFVREVGKVVSGVCTVFLPSRILLI